MKKAMNIITPIMLVLLLAFNIFTYAKVRLLEGGEMIGEVEDVAQENDVSIGEQYVIKSTEHISDAYRSGDASALSAKDAETLNMAKAVLDEIITDGMNDFEKERAVYDWMCANIGFDSDSMTVIPESEADCDNPYGVLKYDNAVCVGYATTFRLFMQMLGIDCMVVHDSYLSHSWNLVKLDGEWYHTDVYSDAPDGGYANFNLNDDTMMNMQEWNTEFFPASEGYEYNYAYINRVCADDAYDIPAAVREAMDEGKPVLGVELGSDGGDADYVLAEAVLDKLQSRLSKVDGGAVPYAWINWSWLNISDSESLLVISIISDSEEPAEPDITESQLARIDAAINAAFGG